MFHSRAVLRRGVRTVLVTACALVIGIDEVAGGINAAVVFHGLRDAPVIALTIDDGSSLSACRSMARTLRDHHVVATFFPVGWVVRAHPRFWAGIARSFPIGNHTVSHAFLTTLDSSEIQAQIRRAEDAIEKSTGRAVIHVLRPPGGSWDRTVRRAAAAAGYRVLLIWDTSAGDTSLNSKPSGMIRSALRGQSGSVLLMHCNRQVSADILPAIIHGYRARGFRFVTVPQLLARMGYIV
jgi:peptidoglycan/xylan/chitin deacetylase (PgdA/CDA1 family)